MEQPTTDEILQPRASEDACDNASQIAQTHGTPATATVRRPDVQGLFGILAASLLVPSVLSLLVTPSAGDHQHSPTLDSERTGFIVDVNSATAAELDLLPQVGRVLAERIVAERERNGPFETLDDMVRTPGFGQVRLDRLKPLLTIGPGQPTPDTARYQVAKPPLEELESQALNAERDVAW